MSLIGWAQIDSLLYILHMSLSHFIDGLVQEDVTPLLTHWSYIFLALTHRYTILHHNITVSILAGNSTNFSKAMGLIKLYMPGV